MLLSHIKHYNVTVVCIMNFYNVTYMVWRICEVCECIMYN